MFEPIKLACTRSGIVIDTKTCQLIFLWLLLIGALGADYRSLLNQDDTGFVSIIKTVRFTAPFFAFCCSLYLIFQFDRLLSGTIERCLFGFYVISALSLLPNRVLDLNEQQVYLSGLTAIVIIALIRTSAYSNPKMNLKHQFSFFFYTTVACLVAIYVSFLAVDMYLSFQKHFYVGYDVFSESRTILGTVQPRSTGMARTAVLILIACIFMRPKNISTKCFYLLLSGLCGFGIYYYQSRGGVLLLALMVLLLVYAEFRSRTYDRILFFGYAIAISLAITLCYHFLFFENLSEVKNQVTVSNWKTTRQLVFLGNHSRVDIWTQGFSSWLTAPLSGFGFQADRALISTSAHNALIYILLSTGVLGLCLWFKIGLSAIGLIQKWLLYPANFSNTENSCIVILLVICARATFETGFVLFGIDFLLFLTCMTVLASSNQKHHTKK